eukprot:m.16342 g.16342  ORF g.16342 m.16342 type:complete len:347 (+) comp5670_c0_seq2:184-1224(+)
MASNQTDNVSCGVDSIFDVSSSDFPTGPDDIENAFSLEKFKKKMKLDIVSMSQDEMEFDLVGVDASYANALRRILIAEVPTMAIESCMIYKNTSLMHDEVLAHRLGLVPIKADPRQFDFVGDLEEFNDTNHIEFKLEVKCTKNPNAHKESADPEELYLHSNVTTADLEWIPKGDQKEKYGDIRPVHEDILLIKLRPGQEINIRMYCVKGIGKDHAKWSPVGTASYRLHPHIELKKQFTGEQAKRLQACFAPGVIELVKGEAKVSNTRACTMSREVHRHDEFRDFVSLQRRRNHFIFSVESIGCYPSASDLVSCAFNCLNEKIDFLMLTVNEKANEGGEDDNEEEES